MRKISRTVVLVATLFLAFGFMTGGIAYAEELTITVNSGASLAITPSVEGIFVSTEDEGNTSASFSVATDNYTGYNLTFSTGNEGDFATKLTNTVVKNGETSIYTINSIGMALDRNAFNSEKYNNMWGIKPSKYNSEVNTSYLPILDNMTLDNVQSKGINDYTIAVGVRADYENPAGKYTNTLVLTAVANPTSYEVPVAIAGDTGVSSVAFTPVGSETGAGIVISGEDEKVELLYGVTYEMEVTFEEGYELDEIEVTSGELDAEAGTYKIEITDFKPSIMVAGKVES